jgi:pseudaminic acid biosynthesis-associated methylase
MTTQQVEFWRGNFGNAYTDRNNLEPHLLRMRTAMWAKILSPTMAAPPQTILEIGANIGVNLRVIRALSGARLMAVEPNDKARGILIQDQVVAEPDLRAGIASAIDFPDGTADLVFTSGVFIHIHPDDLLGSMKEIHRVSSRYIACVEYFSDTPTEVLYRGHSDKLFKRDFGGEWLDHFPDLVPVAYGFEWKRVTGLDNLTWWLFEKR